MVAPILLALSIVTGCTAVDGDTLRCGTERIRLLAIDSAEMPGHCRRGRLCASGDPHRAKRHLSAALRPRMPIERVGKDRYGRTLAVVGDLSCRQLRSGDAIYVPKWDNGGRIAAMCPGAARR